MDLKDFISNSISEIAEAIQIADEKLKPIGGMANPGTHTDKMVGRFVAPRTTLNFDVALSASKIGEGGAGVKGSIFVVEASLGGKGKMSSETISRLSFSLDIVLPQDDMQIERVGVVQRPRPK
jgi:hypothetical protein